MASTARARQESSKESSNFSRCVRPHTALLCLIANETRCLSHAACTLKPVFDLRCIVEQGDPPCRKLSSEGIAPNLYLDHKGRERSWLGGTRDGGPQPAGRLQDAGRSDAQHRGSAARAVVLVLAAAEYDPRVASTACTPFGHRVLQTRAEAGRGADRSEWLLSLKADALHRARTGRDGSRRQAAVWWGRRARPGDHRGARGPRDP
mmetsp:Transcript_7523/g.20532  ORF Transcript_7523/g.20532 Transcript_7523/m.20532 type:complete len:206 (-) Transcript_7523:4168-4785(-)